MSDEQHVISVTQDNLTTIRYAVEEYLKKMERHVKKATKKPVEDRTHTDHEDLMFYDHLASQCNEILFNFKYLRERNGVDI